MYEQAQGYYASQPQVGAMDVAASRARFLTRTYLHLLGAIVLFTGIEVALFQLGLALPIAKALFSVPWILVLGAFILAGSLFSGVAARAPSLGAQYAALAGYVVIEAVIFIPLLLLVEINAPGAIGSAAALTLVGFGALTGIVMTTSANYSALRGVLTWAGVSALMLIGASLLFGLTLGVWFSFAMVVYAGAVILYRTDRIMRAYPDDRYVAAALALFASVALMFWYVLRIFSRR
jgi:FtsH-binding integral membrane protein